MGCSSRGPWSAFPWSWRPPRSSTGKTKVVGLVELSMPAPLDYADYDGTFMYFLALCDPPIGGPTYCRPLSGCRPPVPASVKSAPFGANISTRSGVWPSAGGHLGELVVIWSRRRAKQRAGPNPKLFMLFAVYAVYAVSSLDTGVPLRHRTRQRSCPERQHSANKW